MRDEVKLRSAGAGDLPFLFELYCDVRGPEIAAWGWPEAQRDAFLRMQFEAQRRSYLAGYSDLKDSVVFAGVNLIGRTLVAGTQGGLHLVDVALLSEFRNRGIGTRLLQELIAGCREAGRPLSLHVLRGNPAVHLYQRLGFREVSSDAMYCQMVWSGVEAQSR